MTARIPQERFAELRDGKDFPRTEEEMLAMAKMYFQDGLEAILDAEGSVGGLTKAKRKQLEDATVDRVTWVIKSYLEYKREQG